MDLIENNNEDVATKNARMEALMETRLQLEQSYAQQWQEGRRMRKKKQHMETLMIYFLKDPVWDY